MKKPLKIRTYLFISQALLLIISIGAIGFIWSRNEYDVITQETQRLLRERADLISNVVGHEISEHGSAELERMEFPQVHIEEDMRAVFVDNSGVIIELVRGTVNQNEAELFKELSAKYHPTQGSISTLINSSAKLTSVFVASPVFDDGNERMGTVCLLMPIGFLADYTLRLRWLLSGAILVVVFLGALGSVLLTNYFSRQFTRVQTLAADVTNGNYHLRIPEEGPTELRDLSHYLNEMAEKLEKQLKMRQTLLANVAHELARPLAGLLLGIESLRKGAFQDPDLADDLLVNMAQTIRRLEDMVDDVALAGRPDTIPLELNRTAVSLRPFLNGVATRYWALADSRGIKLELNIENGIPYAYADEKRLNQIMGNLMDNAIKFTPHGKMVFISAECFNGNKVRLLVRDGGDGITNEEVERIFEPFFQGNTGRRIKQGMGLGLAISYQLALAHQGRLELKNHPDGGALAILTLPIANH